MPKSAPLKTLPDGHIPKPLHPMLETAWARFLENADEHQQQRLAARLEQHSELAQQLARACVLSRFLVEQLIVQPDSLLELLESGDLQRCYARGTLPHRVRERAEEVRARGEDFATPLRLLRRREMSRIVWRDLLRIAPLEETTTDLSELADACIGASAEFLYPALCAEWGVPQGAPPPGEGEQPLLVLGMGKLGGRELNVSSDVDLIFAYAGEGRTEGGKRSCEHQVFFQRFAQQLIALLDKRTAAGFVFRVDTRLRPYGDSGALAWELHALEDYYQSQGRPWERYALLRARPLSGSPQARRELWDLLHPFVFRHYTDFSTLEEARSLKQSIELQRRRSARNHRVDLKKGRGGIRELEFIVQTFQLVHGGRDENLRRRGTLAGLDALGAGDYLPRETLDELREAYRVLRCAEHAVQGWEDSQDHALPEEPLARTRFAFALDFASWEECVAQINEQRERVNGHFRGCLNVPQEEAVQPRKKSTRIAAGRGARAGGNRSSTSASISTSLLPLGEAPPELREPLEKFYAKTLRTALPSEAQRRLERFLPVFLAQLVQIKNPPEALRRTMPVIEAVLRRSAYLALLSENPKTLRRLVELCGHSSWVADILRNHPMLLDELLDPRRWNLGVQPSQLRDALYQQARELSWERQEEHMKRLRYFRMSAMLQVAVSDIVGTLPLMKVSDTLCHIAEVVLRHLLNLVWYELCARHGRPRSPDGAFCNPGFLILAYGKLGGLEIGYDSDLDLVCVYDADPNQMTEGGEQPLNNASFFTRLVQRLLHFCRMRTTLGSLYEVDMRLRPDSSAGFLVNDFAAFREYEESKAWIWEHQALVRARPVAGCPALARRFGLLRRDLLGRRRDARELRAAVREMRERMGKQRRAASRAGGEVAWQVKNAPGGILDLEFLVQYAVLAWGADYPDLSLYTDNIRILEILGKQGLLGLKTARDLGAAYQAYRGVVHLVALDAAEHAAEAREVLQQHAPLVREVWEYLLGDAEA